MAALPRRLKIGALTYTVTEDRVTAGLGDEWGRLTPHLLAALRDNPKLIAYLTAP